MQIDEQVLEHLPHWYDFAILELTATVDFNASPSWIARRLGISPQEVEASLQRLDATGFIDRSHGAIAVRAVATRSEFATPSLVLKLIHEQLIQLSLSALFHQAVSERAFDSHILAVDPARFTEAKDRLAAFARDFVAEFSAAPEKREVYALSMQFFRLTAKPG